MGGMFGFDKSDSESAPSADLQAPEFQQLRPEIAAIFQGLFSGGTANPMGGIPKYSGPLTAQIAPGEQQMLDFLQQQGAGAGSNLLGQTAAGAFVPQNGQLDPFTQGALDASIAPFQREQQEFLRRQLPSQFTAAGQQLGPGGSSAASRFGMIQSADIAQRAAEVGAGLAFQQREAERGRQQETIQLGQQEIQTAVTNLQAQALPRLIQEMGIERGLQEFQARTTALLQALAVASGTAAPTHGQVSESSSFGIDMAGGVGYGASLRAFKTDIERLGQTADGIPIYSFRYKGRPETHIGVMADEAAAIRPDAVDGLGIVNYGRL